MKTIAILALHQAELAAITDTRQAFLKVNAFLKAAGEEAMFNIQVVGFTAKVALDGGLISIQPEVITDQLSNPDLIIIPALTGDMLTATHLNRMYGGWIATQYSHGTAVAALSTGTFLLAFAGLLKDKQCTTHWAYANEFRHFYPLSTLVDDKIITDQQGVYSSGGGSAYWNLLLHLIEKYTDRKMAIRIAKYFVIDMDKHRQSPFIIFNGLKDHPDQMVLGAQEYIEAHYSEKFTVDDLAAMFNTVRRTLERRFKKATRKTVVEYIQRVKIEAAKRQLETGAKTVSEIMLDAGYTDIQTFRELFKYITGMTPVDYRRKFHE